MKRKIFITLLLPLMIISNIFVTVKAEDSLDYNEGIIYKPSRYTVEYVEKNDFPDLTAYDLHLNNKVNNVEQYLLSLCIEKNYYEYSDGTTLREYTSEIIPQLYPKFKEIIEITKSDYVFSVSYVTTDGKEVFIDYKDNDVIEKIVYDESSDTAYHYYDGKYSIEYHFRESYSITMSEELSNRLNVLLEQGKYDEIEDIKGLLLYKYDDGSYAIDIDTDYIVRTYNEKNNNADKSAPTNDSELPSSLKSTFPDYTNNLLCTYYPEYYQWSD